MAYFNFVIPLSKDDLFEAASGKQYVVENVYNQRDLRHKLQDAAASVQQQGADFVLFEGFDIIISLIGEFNKGITTQMKEQGYDICTRGMRSLVNELSEITSTGKVQLDTEERLKQLNKFKMLLYLYTQLVEVIEAEQLQADPLLAPKQKGKKKNLLDDDYQMCWERERSRAVTIIYDIVQLNLSSLFDPPIIEEEVVNLVGNCMFKILENPTMAHVKCKDVRASVIQVLGTISKRFNYSLSCSLKVVQELKHFEHLAPVMGQATETMVTEFGCNNMVMEVVREIARLDPKELGRDSSGTRSYAQYIMELAERLPEAIRPYIHLLIDHLEHESVSMRKCVLTVLGEIVAKVLTKEDLPDSDKDDRDNFLDYLEDHVHDINALVRSHALHIWSKLCASKCIPLNRQNKIFELAGGRLMDKSSNVRKAAIQLLNTLMQSNPFAAKLQSEELEQNLGMEREKLKTMIGSDSIDDESGDPLVRWNKLQDSVKEQLASKKSKEKADDKVWENAAAGEVCARIVQFLEKGQLHRAKALLASARQEFTDDADLFEDGGKKKKEQQEGEDDEDKEQEPAENEDEASDSEEEEMETDEEEEENSDEEGPSKKKPKISRKDEKLLNVFRNIYLETQKKPEMSQSQDSANKLQEEEVAKQKMLVQFLSDCVKFSRLIDKSLPLVADLLASKQTSDVLEAIEFFIVAFEFGVSNSMLGVRKMLERVFSREANIKDAVVAAYKRLYINVETTSARATAIARTRNLIALVSTASLGDLVSLEKLLAELVIGKEIGKPEFTVLWEYFTGMLPDVGATEARAAIMLLGMCANSELSIVTSNIQVIQDHGLGEKAKNDFRLAQQSCKALLKIVPHKIKQDDPKPPFKFTEDHNIFEQLKSLLVDGVFKKELAHYLPMAQAAVKLVYQLCESPDHFASEVLSQICKRLAEECAKPEGESETMPESQAPGSQVSLGGDSLNIDSIVLQRFCYLLGDIALNQLNYLNVNVFNELKRRNTLREAKAENDKKAKQHEKNKKKKRLSMRTAAMDTPRGVKDVEDDDMGVVGAEADDAEAEFIRLVCEKEIVNGGDEEGKDLTLLAAFAPFLVSVCSNPTKYADKDLRSSASLALTKYMMVSSEFCEKYLQLIFTMLEKETYSVIRANLVVSLGDLLTRFPNTVEPWTPKLYARLHDDSVNVRLNTMRVLYQLILNDSIKVKMQISDLACCLVDQVDAIAGLAKVFFSELARKGNTLYNLVPDIVSRLSDPEIGIQEDHFRIILKYIIDLIDKDKLVESLVEKLCHRLRANRTKRQWRDVTFCLSLFPYNSRAFRKLSDNFACWSDKLYEDGVYQNIQTIFAGVKKGVGAGPVGQPGNSRMEIKEILEQLEPKVEEARAKGVEDATSAQRAADAADAKKQKNNKKSGNQSAKKRGKRQHSSDEEDEEEEQEEEAMDEDKENEEEVATDKKPSSSRRSIRGGRKLNSSSMLASDEDEADFKEPEVPLSSKKRPNPQSSEAPRASERSSRRRR